MNPTYMAEIKFQSLRKCYLANVLRFLNQQQGIVFSYSLELGSDHFSDMLLLVFRCWDKERGAALAYSDCRLTNTLTCLRSWAFPEKLAIV
jgi:hypothetical protein